jgi:flagellar M-ring protein FliF
VFVREQAKPSASVLLTLFPGRMLDRSQVQAIGHLISSSVPNLPLANVTVVDQAGRLLSSSFQDNASGLDPTQLNYVREIEQGYIKRIEAILGPVLGDDNVRAQVTADVDLDNTEQMAETYRPNQDPTAGAVRSSHTSESTQNKANAQGGVPGALSNQPPTAPRMLPTAPAPAAASQPAANGPNAQQPAAATANSATTGNGTESSTRDTTLNYEVDKTVRRTRAAVGTVRRLSVAVVVNYRGDGKTWKPLSDAEMTKLNALVKDAVGYDAKRGDSVNVVNSQFSGTLPQAKDDLPLWKQPEMVQYGIQAAKYGALAIAFLILVFAVIRPLIRSAAKKSEPVSPTFVGREGDDPNAPIITGAAAAAGPGLEGPHHIAGALGSIDDLPDDLPQLSKNNDFEKKLETMRRIAQQNPRAVAAVIKQWVSNE